MAPPNHKNLREEPGGRGIGRSRGDVTSKIHHIIDGSGYPLVVLIGPGQGHDGSMLPSLMDSLHVARDCSGRPPAHGPRRPGCAAPRRTRPER